METKTKEIIEATIDENIKTKSEKLPTIQPEEQSQLEKALSELDFNDRNSIIYFGASAQEELDDISNRMIDGVKNKDTGAAGMVLNEMVAAIKGFDIEELNPNKSLPWYKKLFGGVKPLTKFIQGYEEVRDQIDMIANNLEEHKSTLMRDVVSLDKLYEANLNYFRKLELYIEAGEIKKAELEKDIIPEYEKKAEDNEMMAIQELKEIRAFHDDLERRIHDLRLSRQVAMQSLPSIRLIQENDKSLINKISSTLVNTVPLWRNQLAQTVTIFRSHESAKALKDATDLTNELLEKNAEGLRDANREVRTQMERGVFDIESIKKANNTLIETLNDSLKIADAGKEARTKALIELEKTEHELKEALLATKSKMEVIPNNTLDDLSKEK
ncbi:Tellurite resistance protein [hydrothermal vent metagenome]|uniref:Tellurite resistance protein n=1 Tax=hydrothermal vent metagenome TaxID=652676 RepID=A0A1W1BM17_9ZZZZ